VIKTKVAQIQNCKFLEELTVKLPNSTLSRENSANSPIQKSTLSQHLQAIGGKIRISS
jgi:hypothetical protein